MEYSVRHRIKKDFAVVTIGVNEPRYRHSIALQYFPNVDRGRIAARYIGSARDLGAFYDAIRAFERGEVTA